jgi:integrase
MTTPHVLSFREWDEKGQDVIIAEAVLPKRKNELDAIRRKLKRDLGEFQRLVKAMETRGDYSSLELLRSARNRQQGEAFCAYILKKSESLRQQGRFGTAHAYRYAAVSSLKFLDGKDIGIDKVNAALMEDYQRYLVSEGKSRNTVSCYMRSLRAAYNSAVREKVFTRKRAGENPFSNVFTGNAGTKKRAINKESISLLMKVRRPELAFSRDLFLFSFYTQGMCFSDMVDLKKENIKGGFIRYKRKKTGQMITIELEDCMRKIIESYAGCDPEFVFPLLRGKGHDYDRWKKTGSALAVYNRNLRKLAGLAGIEEHLTSYVARHSWASIASHAGIPIATISRGMGHESEKTTRIYISKSDYSDVSRANKQILSYFVGKPPAKQAGLQFVPGNN